MTLEFHDTWCSGPCSLQECLLSLASSCTPDLSHLIVRHISRLSVTAALSAKEAEEASDQCTSRGNVANGAREGVNGKNLKDFARITGDRTHRGSIVSDVGCCALRIREGQGWKS